MLRYQFFNHTHNLFIFEIKLTFLFFAQTSRPKEKNHHLYTAKGKNDPSLKVLLQNTKKTCYIEE